MQCVRVGGGGAVMVHSFGFSGFVSYQVLSADSIAVLGGAVGGDGCTTLSFSCGVDTCVRCMVHSGHCFSG